MGTITEPIAISLKEASQYTGVPERSLQKLVDKPDCPFILRRSKQGQKLLLRRKALVEYLENHEID